MIKQSYQCVCLCYSKPFFQFLQVYCSFWERLFLQQVTPGADLGSHLIHGSTEFYAASFHLCGKRCFSACNTLQIKSKNFGSIRCLPLVFHFLFKVQCVAPLYSRCKQPAKRIKTIFICIISIYINIK